MAKRKNVEKEPEKKANQPMRNQPVDLQTMSSAELGLRLQEQYQQAQQVQQNIWAINQELTKRMSKEKTDE